MEGSDGTADTTTLVQIEETKCAIRKLPFVTVLAPVRAVGDKGRGWQASLSCSRCKEYGSCPEKQEPDVSAVKGILSSYSFFFFDTPSTVEVLVQDMFTSVWTWSWMCVVW